MKRTISLCISILLLLSTQVSVYANNFNFEDVSKEAWYYNDVNESVQLGLMQGYSSTVFAPDDNLTLSQAIKLASTVHSKVTCKVISTSQNGHWVLPYYSYAIVNGIVPDVYSAEDWDVIISRRQMASLFARAIPDSEYVKINDFALASEPLYDANIRKLFEMGILIGSDNGFNAEANITRAETSAIINRVLNSDNRVKVENAPANEKVWVNPKTYNPKLLYVSDPFDGIYGAQQISLKEFEGSNPIRVLYNHTYNCYTQEEYDAVINAVTECYLELMKDYKPSSKIQQFIDGTMPDSEMQKSYVQKVLRLLPNDFKGQCDLLLSMDISNKVYSKLRSEYILSKHKTRTNDDVNELLISEGEIDAYSVLFSDCKYTCEATSSLNMAIYDVMGYNSSAFGSVKLNHMTVGIEISGVWITTLYESNRLSLEETRKYLPDVFEGCYSTVGDIHSAGRVIVRR